jgi:hypothetical protein
MKTPSMPVTYKHPYNARICGKTAEWSMCRKDQGIQEQEYLQS